MVSHLCHNEVSKMGIKLVKDLKYLIREIIVVFLKTIEESCIGPFRPVKEQPVLAVWWVWWAEPAGRGHTSLSWIPALFLLNFASISGPHCCRPHLVSSPGGLGLGTLRLLFLQLCSIWKCWPATRVGRVWRRDYFLFYFIFLGITFLSQEN